MINYGIIADSIKFYETKGFRRIESPWTVSSPISNITKPEGAKDFSIAEKNKVLVASGEQSFLYLYNKGFLPYGAFQTVTPCFRDEIFTPLNTKYFIKNELIITDEEDEITLDRLAALVTCARDFFRKYIVRPKKFPPVFAAEGPDDVVIMETTNGRNKIIDKIDVNDTSYMRPCYDLVYRGIELGSYGIRECEFLTWIYGTGVAEPRLTRVMQKYGIPS